MSPDSPPWKDGTRREKQYVLEDSNKADGLGDKPGPQPVRDLGWG